MKIALRVLCAALLPVMFSNNAVAVVHIVEGTYVVELDHFGLFPQQAGSYQATFDFDGHPGQSSTALGPPQAI